MNDGAAPPDRKERQACWDSRDAYFTCLDANKIDVPGQEGRACLKSRKDFEQDCVRSWVDYFTKRRVMQARQRMMEEQASASRGTGVGPSPPLKRPSPPQAAPPPSPPPPAAALSPPPPAEPERLV